MPAKIDTLDTEAELMALFGEYRATPSVRLRDRLFAANYGLVQMVARRWTHLCSEPFEDLEQEGAFGLIRAIERFDPQNGNAFSSFAVAKIQGAILHYLRDKGWGTLRIPRRCVEIYSRVQRVQRIMIGLGERCSLEEVAIGLGYKADLWRYVREARERPYPASLDRQEEDWDIPATTHQDDWDTEGLYGVLLSLPETQRECVEASVFGGQTTHKIARRMGIPLAVVELFIEQGLGKLRESIE